MARLINPGVGELVDRASILTLKLLHAPADSAPHLRREYQQVLAIVQPRTTSAGWIAEALELTVVNGVLWHAEDDLRAVRDGSQLVDGDLIAAGRIAFRIQALNDRRNELIGEINKTTGEWAGEEKVR